MAVDTRNLAAAVALCIVIVMMGSYVAREVFLPERGALTQEEAEHTPAPAESVLLTTRINQGASALDVKVVPLEVLEDSRCPQDVQCIWAGTVRVRALLSSGLGEAPQVFELGQPITTEVEEVTLVEVTPAPQAGTSIPLNDYRFIFSVKKR